ncbi:hypothetical protein OCF84_21240 (plasmid) [Shewanella xiamenensis]|uniref:Uncharacterized protein n=1 Tax=Shewanella xiamenensis TaxID=332186 RepID=A0ABT6UDQ4_9GAMM|nr:hypothetical protein [Shewanella xiamenensis]MDI5832598.1 hypothetical protein [Shewanella xiamenensis]WHF57784.1 hypothetical protein OCF84_21240 [Shewanella xiamenensis]
MDRDSQYIKSLSISLFEEVHASVSSFDASLERFKNAIADQRYTEAFKSFLPQYISGLAIKNQVDTKYLNSALNLQSGVGRVCCDELIRLMAVEDPLVAMIEDGQLQTSNYVCANIYHHHISNKFKSHLNKGEIIDLSDKCCLDLVECLYAEGISPKIIMEAIFPKNKATRSIVTSLTFASEIHHHLLFEYDAKEFDKLFENVSIEISKAGMFDKIVNFEHESTIFDRCVFRRYSSESSKMATFENMKTKFVNSVLIYEAGISKFRSDNVSISAYKHILKQISHIVPIDCLCRHLAPHFESEYLSELIGYSLLEGLIDYAMGFYKCGMNLNVAPDLNLIKNKFSNVVEEFNSIAVTATLDEITDEEVIELSNDHTYADIGLSL